MYYYVKVNGQYVVSPKWRVYTLSDDKKGLYLWSSEESARLGCAHLIKPGDKVEIIRTYQT